MRKGRRTNKKILTNKFAVKTCLHGVSTNRTPSWSEGFFAGWTATQTNMSAVVQTNANNPTKRFSRAPGDRSHACSRLFPHSAVKPIQAHIRLVWGIQAQPTAPPGPHATPKKCDSYPTLLCHTNQFIRQPVSCDNGNDANLYSVYIQTAPRVTTKKKFTPFPLFLP